MQGIWEMQQSESMVCVATINLKIRAKMSRNQVLITLHMIKNNSVLLYYTWAEFTSVYTYNIPSDAI